MTKRLITLITLTVATVLVASACLVTYPPYQGNTSGPKVVYFGDSIGTDQVAGPQIRVQLQVNDQIVKYSTSGVRFDWHLSNNAPNVASRPDRPSVAVLELGTNDARTINDGTWTLAQTEQAIDSWMTVIPGVTCVVFVTPSTHTTIDGQHASAQAIIDYERALTDPRVRFADWDAVVAANGANVVTYDGTHPNGEPATPGPGAGLLAGIISSAVDTCP